MYFCVCMGGLNAKGDKRKGSDVPGGWFFGWCGPAEKGGQRRLAADLWTLMGSSRLNGIIAGCDYSRTTAGIILFFGRNVKVKTARTFVA